MSIKDLKTMYQCVKRLVVAPPSSPGSKGDEGMVRGLLRAFQGWSILILNPENNGQWLPLVNDLSSLELNIEEVTGPLTDFRGNLRRDDVLIILGADVVDGTCGTEPSLARLGLVEAGLSVGAKTFVFCSFRSSVSEEILGVISRCKETRFYMRDPLSSFNFRSQTGREAGSLADFFIFCKAIKSPRSEAEKEVLLEAKAKGYQIIAANFCEHAFRSFYDDHTDANRRSYVRNTLDNMAGILEEAYFLIISNDSRQWDNFPSDATYQKYAKEWALSEGYTNRHHILDPEISYEEVLYVLSAVELVVTGRMHLALASFKAGTLPLVLMGKDCQYTSIDKMKGAFTKYVGSGRMVISDQESLRSMLELFISGRLYHREYIRERTEEIGRQSYEDINELKDFILHGRRDSQFSADFSNAQLKNSISREDSRYQSGYNEEDWRSSSGHHSSSNLDQDWQGGMITSMAGTEALRGFSIPSNKQEATMVDQSGSTDQPSKSTESEEEDLESRNMINVGRDAEVSKLYDLVSERDRTISSMTRHAKERELELRAVSERLADQEDIANKQRYLLLRSTDKIDELERSLSAYLSEIASLREKVDTSNKLLRATLHRTYSSLSRLLIPELDKIQSANSRAETAPWSAQFVGQGSCKILVADYRVPRADVSAGERATFGILSDLISLGYEVTMLPHDMASSPKYLRMLSDIGVNAVTSDWGYDSAKDFIVHQGHQYPVFYIFRTDIAEKLLPVYRQQMPNGRVILHAPDLAYLRQQRKADLIDDRMSVKQTLVDKSRDLRTISLADHLVTVSPVEAEMVRVELPATESSVMPALYTPISKEVSTFDDRRHIFFLGGFSHQPNINAVHWFVHEVWPIILELIPDVEFFIIGSEATDSILALGQLPRIRVLGAIENIDPLLSLFRVGVAPLLYGAGIKGKVAMSMGQGIPCVCTEIAAEGMGIINERDALVVPNDPRLFAEAVKLLYTDRDKWLEVSRNGRALVEDHFGYEANQRALVRVLNQAKALPLDLYVDYCKRASRVPLPRLMTDQNSVNTSLSIIIKNISEGLTIRSCVNALKNELGKYSQCTELVLIDGAIDSQLKDELANNWILSCIDQVNEGRVAALNSAISQTSGEFVLILDAEVLIAPGYFDSIKDIFQANQSCAIIDSKVINSESIVTDAGIGIHNDGSLHRFGRRGLYGSKKLFATRYDEFYNLSREIDSSTDSCFVLRRKHWNDLNGFDDKYIYPVFALADFGLRCRSRQLHIRYNHKAEVICLKSSSIEPGSMSHDTSSINTDQQRLLDNWSNILTRIHLDPGSPGYQVAAKAERSIPESWLERRNSKKLNILYFSPFPSHPSNHGNQATIQQFGKYLQSIGHCVHFVLLQNNLFSPKDEEEMRRCWDSLTILPNNKHLGANGDTIDFDGWYEDGLGERIRLLCSKHEIDIVFCSYIFHSKLLEYVPDYILKVIDTHDKMGDRYDMLKKNGQPLEFFSCTQNEEGRYLRRADIVCARRQEEASYFNTVSGKDSAVVVPHFEVPHFISREYLDLEKVGIVASANRINLAIVHDFLNGLDEFMAGEPGFKVIIAGQVKDLIKLLQPEKATVFSRPWVELRGFVEDIADFYNEMDLIVSPVTMGTGINVKTVQALAFGMPLLTTAWGSKGIGSNYKMHNYPDLVSLTQGLMKIKRKPQILNKLSGISRNIYHDFLDKSHSGLNHVIHKALQKSWTLDIDDPFAKEFIACRVQDFFGNIDRSTCHNDSLDLSITFDGKDTAESIKHLIKKPSVHDDDFLLIKPFARPDSVFLDIGANWGYSVTSIWAVVPDQKVISFEPIKPYEGVLQVIKDLCPNKFDYRIMAIGDEEKVARFVVPVVNGIALSALASARYPSKPQISGLANNIYNYVRQWMAGTREIELSMLEFDSPMHPLDLLAQSDSSLLGNNRVSLIKIDAEGYEPQVLFGAESILRMYKPAVLLEGGCRYEGLPSFMDRLGYSYFEREGLSLTEVTGQSTSPNGFFIHQDQMEELRIQGLIST